MSGRLDGYRAILAVGARPAADDLNNLSDKLAEFCIIGDYVEP